LWLSRPTTFPLFPYTTLFRSRPGAAAPGGPGGPADPAAGAVHHGRPLGVRDPEAGGRPLLARPGRGDSGAGRGPGRGRTGREGRDRKSTRLNSSHVKISYAVF